MAHDQHAHLVHEVEELFKPVLSNSPQAIYIYLDDAHKICNKKYADMLGYKSVKEWVDNEYPIDDVDEKDQPKGMKAYMAASEKLQAGNFTGTLVKRNGRKFKAQVIMTPFTYKGEVFVVHFISKEK